VPGRPIAVVDLDGVVADVRHRLHHINAGRKDWDGFFAAVGDDPVLAEGRAVVDRLVADHDIVFLTGRPERTRDATLGWLRRHGLPRGELVMRGDADRRPARLFKAAALRRLARSGRRVALVVDDDAAVCAALEDEGWTVLRADWVERPAPLRQAQDDLGRT
jgi:hypothetical protein